MFIVFESKLQPAKKTMPPTEVGRERRKEELRGPLLFDANNDKGNDGSDNKEANDGHDLVKVSPPPGAIVLRFVQRLESWFRAAVEVTGTVVVLLLYHCKHWFGRKGKKGCYHPGKRNQEPHDEQNNLSISFPLKAIHRCPWGRRRLPNTRAAGSLVLAKMWGPNARSSLSDTASNTHDA
jgi:hypothetical protein